MSRRYTDVKLPLDLSDEELVGDPAELNLAIQAMDKDGWNTKRRSVRASWVVGHLFFASQHQTKQFLSACATYPRASAKKSLSSLL